MDLDDGQHFRVRDAIAAGFARAAVDASRFDMPFHGLRSPLGGASEVVDRCRAYRLKMRPDAAFTALTAAALWGVPLPARVDFSRIHVSVPHGMPRPRSRGVIGSERGWDVEVVTLGGLRVLEPAAMWASLGTWLGIADLVAAGDYVIGGAGSPSRTNGDRLNAAITRNAPGAPRLGAALRHVRPGSMSRPESLLRVLLTMGGVPEPALNLRLAELPFVLDLAWPQVRFGIEYQGDHHRDPAQFGADIRRQELVHDRGWLLMGVTRYDLFDRPLELLERARSRLADRGVASKGHHPPNWALPRR